MIGGLQGENRDLNNKYLKKKYKRFGRKYLGVHSGFCKLKHDLRKFRKLNCPFRKLDLDFAS